MFGHYIRIALRNFRRSPVATGINVLALGLGLTCFMIAYAVVGNWDHADQSFAKVDRIYAITADFAMRDGSAKSGVMPITNDVAAKYIKADFPELEAIARARSFGEPSLSAAGKTLRLPVAFVDPSFLDIFDLPFIAGTSANAMSQPGSVVLTESAATKLYGSPSAALGKTLLIGREVDATVTGVIGPIPQPSHMGSRPSASLRFDVLGSWDIYKKFADISRKAAEANQAAQDKSAESATDEASTESSKSDSPAAPEDKPARPEQPENWLGGFCCTTYVLLPKDGSLDGKTLNAHLASFGERRIPEPQQAIARVSFGAIPVSQIVVTSLNALLFGRTVPGLSVTTLLFVLGGLVLAVGALNYANLATAQATKRAREVGMRKVIGARRVQVMFQYILEGAILTVIALLISLVVVEALSPVFENAANIDLGASLFGGLGFWAFLLGLIVTVSLAAGAYPAFVLSGVRPIQALRSGRIRAGPRFVPALLVGLQFCAASFLLIAVIIMYSQNRDLKQTGFGLKGDPLVVITNPSQFTHVKPEDLRRALERIPQVKGITGTSMSPWSLNSISLNIFARSAEESAVQHTVFNEGVGYDYFKTLDIKLLAGRLFDREHGDDVMRDFASLKASQPVNIVVDPAFAKQMGFASPAVAIDQLVYMPAKLTKAFGGKVAQPFRIIGVVDNKPMHFMGLGATSSTFFLTETPTFALVKISGTDVETGRKAIEAAWKKLAPNSPIDLTFMDERFEQSYQVFGQVNEIFGGLALFAFVISSIGLFGMAIQVTGRRLYEIGVRKTLGASTGQIIRMLVTDFSKPVLIANLVAWPLGFVAAKI